jgi:hypothetical protein
MSQLAPPRLRPHEGAEDSRLAWEGVAGVRFNCGGSSIFVSASSLILSAAFDNPRKADLFARSTHDIRFGAIGGRCAAKSGSHPPLFRFRKQKLPANGYSNARKWHYV